MVLVVQLEIEERSLVMSDRDRDRDRDYCPRCGDPAPLDNNCDCAGDPDRDRLTGLAGLTTNRVLTLQGMKKTYTDNYRDLLIDRRRSRAAVNI